MRDSAPLSHEGYSLVLDIYLGGVGGAVIKNGTILYSAHHKAPITENNTAIELLQNTHTLLQKTILELISKKEVTKTYVFIDAPLSFSETSELIFQADDKTFFSTSPREIETAFTLPESYKIFLKNHASDGVFLEHAPTHHTINGYTTSNIHASGERKAFVVQQWIQRNIYTEIQEAARTYSLGKIVYIPPFAKSDTSSDYFLLGDVVSTLAIKNKYILVDAGTRVAIAKSAHTQAQSITLIESVLKSIARNHSAKNDLYKTTLDYFTHASLPALQNQEFVDDAHYSCVYVGEAYMLPIIKDVFAAFKSINFTTTYTDSNARLSFIIKNKVQ